MNRISEIIKSTGFRYNKALGQNFISDENLLAAIVSDSGVTKDDVVVEIGTGAGTLTRALAAVCKKVYSFEVDAALQAVLALSLQGVENAEVIFRDVLKMKDDEIAGIVFGEPKENKAETNGEEDKTEVCAGEIAGKKETAEEDKPEKDNAAENKRYRGFKVVANLPYYITTPLVMRFIESELPVESITVMVQKEVADRFAAKPNTADYAAITLAVNMAGSARVTRFVSREMFFPQPNVDSAVVRIDIERDKLAGEDTVFLKRLVKAAFGMRRKTLANNLSASFGMKKDEAAAKIEELGFSPMVRGEVLSLDDYIKLSRRMKE